MPLNDIKQVKNPIM